MLTEKLTELEKARKAVEQLEKSIEKDRSAQLASLHTDMGYETRGELIEALTSLGGVTRRGRRPGRKAAKKAARKVAKKAAGKAAKKTAAKKAARKGKGKRARLTAEDKQKIGDHLKEGRKSTQLAREFGVSLATVQNIKRALGLTKPR
ncbi:MAG: hypothetical protein EA425_05155 [Puniceicoccaceae bacterium]|nr:MAG: hypothetical protein EA425_05155 [Puniceicoccaceae bacterium]